MAESCKKF